MQSGLHSESGPSSGPLGPGIPPGVKRNVGPMAAGLASDALALATFGPIGCYAGLNLGSAAGWWLAPMLGFPPRGRWLCAIMTGVYCTLPLTGFIPAATVAAGLSHAILRDDEPAEPPLDPALGPEGAIDAEYEVVEDDESAPPRRGFSGSNGGDE